MLEKETLDLMDIVRILGNRPFAMSDSMKDYMVEIEHRKAETQKKLDEKSEEDKKIGEEKKDDDNEEGKKAGGVPPKNEDDKKIEDAGIIMK